MACLTLLMKVKISTFPSCTSWHTITMSPLRPAGVVFPLTRWSVVVAAARGDDRTATRAALTELCQLYWFPLYAFARRQGFGPEDAEDLTQDFFAHVLEKNLFASPDPALGRLRSFLLTVFQHDLQDARKAARREKRGGGREHLPLDTRQAENLYQQEPADPATPERHFERQWALAVLTACIDQIAADYAATGRAALFAELRSFLNPESTCDESCETVAARLGLTPAAGRQAIHRLRERFSLVLRQHIADTLHLPTDEAMDAELIALRAALSL